MSIDAISANRQQFQQARDNYQTLAQALQNGNLTAAQKAYGSIQQEQQNGGPQPPADSPIATAFNDLGQALQSGDLSGAQQAFSSLQDAFQSLRKSGGHHGPHGSHAPDDDQDSSDAATSTDNAQKTVASEVTTTNANGTLTVTTTYTDGSTSSTTEPNPNPTVSKSALFSANSGQLAVLLNAQESAQDGVAA
jgi:hypothetical protein